MKKKNKLPVEVPLPEKYMGYALIAQVVKDRILWDADGKLCPSLVSAKRHISGMYNKFKKPRAVYFLENRAGLLPRKVKMLAKSRNNQFAIIEHPCYINILRIEIKGNIFPITAVNRKIFVLHRLQLKFKKIFMGIMDSMDYEGFPEPKKRKPKANSQEEKCRKK